MIRRLRHIIDELWINYATFIVTSNPKRAVEILSQAKPRPKYRVNQLTWLAIAHRNLDNFREALQAIEKACEIEPNDGDLLYRKAVLHLHCSERDAARSCVAQCLLIDPHDEDALELNAQHGLSAAGGTGAAAGAVDLPDAPDSSRRS